MAIQNNSSNTQISYLTSLQLAGLTTEQATLYEVLLKSGPLPAGKIHQKTPYKRGLVYKLLEQMVELGIIVKRTDIAKIAIFEPAHPLKLKELAEKREEQAKTAQAALGSIINQMTSEFNLVSGKPAVEFYEGRDGIHKVLQDTLQSKTEICSIGDIEAVVKYISDINDGYVASRERLKIQNRGLLLDTPFAREYLEDYHKTVTDNRFIKYDAPPFNTLLKIYDNKISYITLSPDKMIGVIISDPLIFQMHKYLFEYLWKTADDLKSPILTPAPDSSQK